MIAPDGAFSGVFDRWLELYQIARNKRSLTDDERQEFSKLSRELRELRIYGTPVGRQAGMKTPEWRNYEVANNKGISAVRIVEDSLAPKSR